MGRPYRQELDRFPTTYSWALGVDTTRLDAFVEEASCGPLLAVGSGGSLSVAQFAVGLHSRTGHIARAVTPLELRSMSAGVAGASVLLLSAGGSNPDILAAFQCAARLEPRSLMGLCLRTGTPLSAAAAAFQYAVVEEMAAPWGRDGFLATNSLLAFAVVLLRAYATTGPASLRLPSSLPEPAWPPFVTDDWEHALRRETWVLMHEGWATPAAIDLESKLTEAALRSAQLADYRHFAHGRHNWLAKKGRSSAVLSLAAGMLSEPARRTRELIPPDIPVVDLRAELAGPVGAIELMVGTMRAVALVGTRVGTDPGRPGVPHFGRRIYHVRWPADSAWCGDPRLSDTRERAAIQRKVRGRAVESLTDDELTGMRQAYAAYCEKLRNTRFGAVAFDYDGTLCSPADRYGDLTTPVVDGLARLLAADVMVGVATGRGGSAGESLRRSIDRALWRNVLVGYYNGSVVMDLAEELPEPSATDTDPSIARARAALEALLDLSRLARCRYGHRQISVHPVSRTEADRVGAILEAAIGASSGCQVQVLRSAHSFDVVALGATKGDLVRACELAAAERQAPQAALAIGDKGCWPGNDYALLASALSLSVDEPAPGTGAGWNLASPGHRGVQATLEYMSWMRAGRRAVRLRIPGTGANT